ncbi:MAG: phenylacetate--CoA ligase family protein [Pseudomonadota bacterium]
MSYPTYFESFDYAEMLQDYPLGEALQEHFGAMSRDELRTVQEQRFKKVVARAWEIPFYQRLWGDAGIGPSDVRGLDDIERLPVFSKSDIMESVERHPPLGDFSGLESLPPEQRPPLVFHTTSGTTGTPQPLIFGAKSREVQSLLVARAYRFMGLPPAATVQSCYGHGMINGGHYIREAVTRYTNALFLSAGTGLETRSTQQVKLMHTFGSNVLVGFADYIKKLADVAREEGLIPGEHLKIDMVIGHLGMETREALSSSWGGAELFDWYGVGDTGCIAAEGPDHQGLYVWEDAHYLELLDVETNVPVPDGERGNMVVTCLYKDDVYPIIRFNTCDVSELVVDGSDDYGSDAIEPLLPFRRIRGFRGRSDNMVKLRGINVYPHGVGPMLNEVPGFLGEYYCRVYRSSASRDEMAVVAECADSVNQEQLKDVLRRGIGVDVEVEVVPAGATASVTELDRRQKPIRLVDQR